MALPPPPTTRHRTTTVVPIVAFIITIFVVTGILDHHQILGNKQPEAGQVWIKCPDDPFRHADCKTYTILEVRGHYVQYRLEFAGRNDIVDSMSIYYLQNTAELKTND